MTPPDTDAAPPAPDAAPPAPDAPPPAADAAPPAPDAAPPAPDAAPPAPDAAPPAPDAAPPAPDAAPPAPDAPPPTPDAAPPAPDAAPPAPDAAPPLPAGCNAVLTPPVGVTSPAGLQAPGPWQLCGAYGSGVARVIRSSAGGGRIVAVTDSGQAFVLDAATLRKVGSFAHGSGHVAFAALSPDGTQLATVNDVAGEVALWNVDSASLLRVMHRGPAWPSLYGLGEAAFSHDGHRLAVVSVSHLDVYDVATGSALGISARTDIGGGMRVAFAAHDTRLVVGRFTYFGNGPYAGWGRVDLLDAATGDHAVALPTALAIELPAIAVSGDGAVIAVGAAGALGAVSFYDATTGAASGTGTMTATMTGAPLALSSDGARLALLDADGITASVRRTSDGAVLHSVALPNNDGAGHLRGPVAVTPDLATVLAGDLPPHVVTALPLDGGTGRVACGSGHGDAVIVNLALSSDASTLVSTGDAGEAGSRHVWDVATGALESQPPPGALVGASATSPDGTMVASPGADGFFDLHLVATGALVSTFGPHKTRVVNLDFSSDGTLIASASERLPADRSGSRPVVKIWVTATHTLQQDLETTASPGAILFHPDGQHVFVGDRGTVSLWCR